MLIGSLIAAGIITLASIFLSIFTLTLYKRTVTINRQLQESISNLEGLSFFDSLTGIPNRRSFDARFEDEWKRMMREKKQLSVMMIDIDNFKRFNDDFGHQRGDTCLRNVAGELDSCLKRSADFVARYGGEEFCTILPDTDKSGALVVAERMRLKIESELDVTISLGVSATVPVESFERADLIEAADKALYRAKESGRNRIEADQEIP